MKRLALIALTALWLVAPGHKAQADETIDYMNEWFQCIKEKGQAAVGKVDALEIVDDAFFNCHRIGTLFLDSVRVTRGPLAVLHYMGKMEEYRSELRLIIARHVRR